MPGPFRRPVRGGPPPRPRPARLTRPVRCDRLGPAGCRARGPGPRNPAKPREEEAQHGVACRAEGAAARDGDRQRRVGVAPVDQHWSVRGEDHGLRMQSTWTRSRPRPTGRQRPGAGRAPGTACGEVCRPAASGLRTSYRLTTPPTLSGQPAPVRRQGLPCGRAATRPGGRGSKAHRADHRTDGEGEPLRGLAGAEVHQIGDAGLEEVGAGGEEPPLKCCRSVGQRGTVPGRRGSVEAATRSVRSAWCPRAPRSPARPGGRQLHRAPLAGPGRSRPVAALKPRTRHGTPGRTVCAGGNRNTEERNRRRSAQGAVVAFSGVRMIGRWHPRE